MDDAPRGAVGGMVAPPEEVIGDVELGTGKEAQSCRDLALVEGSGASLPLGKLHHATNFGIVAT